MQDYLENIKQPSKMFALVEFSFTNQNNYSWKWKTNYEAVFEISLYASWHGQKNFFPLPNWHVRQSLKSQYVRDASLQAHPSSASLSLSLPAVCETI